MSIGDIYKSTLTNKLWRLAKVCDTSGNVMFHSVVDNSKLITHRSGVQCFYKKIADPTDRSPRCSEVL